jgi:hypothetical protein
VLDLDAELTASQAAQAVRVSRQLFNYWRAQGLIRPCGQRRGRPVYRFGDVVDVEQRMRDTPRSLRRPRPGAPGALLAHLAPAA